MVGKRIVREGFDELLFDWFRIIITREKNPSETSGGENKERRKSRQVAAFCMSGVRLKESCPPKTLNFVGIVKKQRQVSSYGHKNGHSHHRKKASVAKRATFITLCGVIRYFFFSEQPKRSEGNDFLSRNSRAS